MTYAGFLDGDKSYSVDFDIDIYPFHTGEYVNHIIVHLQNLKTLDYLYILIKTNINLYYTINIKMNLYKYY